MDMRTAEEILGEMHKIIMPGEYGLGNEPGSIPDNDKAAWEKLGRLHAELEASVRAEDQRLRSFLERILEISYAGHPDGRESRFTTIERYAKVALASGASASKKRV
jgi:hypothetical protein